MKTEALKDYKLQYEDVQLNKPNRGNPIKVLTKQNKRRIMEPVINNKRKDNKMTNDKTKINKANTIKSIAWLVEAGFRGFVGWILLSNFDHLVTTAVAIYALGTAGVIVVSHFVRANR